MPAAVAIPFVATAADVETVAEALKDVFPWIHVDRSTLGGEARASLFVKVSLDPKETWENGILQNSRWALFAIQAGKLYMAYGGNVPKFRKVDAKSVDNVIGKITAWKDKIA